MSFNTYSGNLLLPSGKSPSVFRPARGIVDPGEKGFAVLRYEFGKDNILEYKDLVHTIYTFAQKNKNRISNFTKQLHGLSYADIRNVYVTIIHSDTSKEFQKAYVFLNCVGMKQEGDVAIKCAQNIDKNLPQNLNNDPKPYDKAVSVKYATRVKLNPGGDGKIFINDGNKREIDGHDIRTFSEGHWQYSYNIKVPVLFLDTTCYLTDMCSIINGFSSCWFGPNTTTGFFLAKRTGIESRDSISRTVIMASEHYGISRKDNYEFKVGLSKVEQAQLGDTFNQDNNDLAKEDNWIPYYHVKHGARYKNSFFFGQKFINKYSDTNFLADTNKTFPSDFLEAGKDTNNPPSADRVPPTGYEVFRRETHNAKNAISFLIDLAAPGSQTSYCFIPHEKYQCHKNQTTNGPLNVKVCTLAASNETEDFGCMDYYKTKMNEDQRRTIIENLCLSNPGLVECDCENRYSNPSYQLARKVGVAAPDACWYAACKVAGSGIWTPPTEKNCGTVCVNIINFSNITNTTILGEIKQNISCGDEELPNTNTQPVVDTSTPGEIFVGAGSTISNKVDPTTFYLGAGMFVLFNVTIIVILAILYKRITQSYYPQQ